MAELSRRQFLGTAAASAAAAALAGGAASIAYADEAEEAAEGTEGEAEEAEATEEAAEESTEEASEGNVAYIDTLDWDGEYDVVVVGFGSAGAVAAVYAALEGASVLIFDTASEWLSGGNSRYADQYMKSGTDYDQLVTFYQQTYGEYPYRDDVIATMAEGLVNIETWCAEDLGGDPDNFATFSYQEFPEYEGSEAVVGFLVSPTTGDASGYYLFRDQVYEHSDSIDVWFNARAQHLIQDPVDKTILGVELEKDDETRRIRADRGVVLACGGFENNQEMLSYYLSLPRCKPIGTTYNRGDGITMAAEVGAKMWHMNCYESFGNYNLGIDIDDSVCEHSRSLVASPILGYLPNGVAVTGATPYGLSEGSFIVVGPDGNRFEDETSESRHGHKYYCGEYVMLPTPSYSYIIMDNVEWTELDGQMHYAVPDIAVSADTVEELAETLGMDYLVRTVDSYNAGCEAGIDYGYNRDIETMRELAEGPYYAIPMIPRILNTQGGPMRDGQAQVLDANEEVIPHLYSAGELGSFVGKDYEGGSNLAECVIYGRMAGITAATEKDDFRMVEGTASTVVPTYTIGSGSTEGNDPREYDLEDNQYLGTARGMGGDIDVIVTMDGDTITAIDIPFQHETLGIGSLAIEQIPEEILEAQSTEVETVTGATITSEALIEAVNAALA